MKIEFFSKVDALKADRVERQYTEKERIAQNNAARAINKIRVSNLDKSQSNDSFLPIKR